jgi:tetratricopeptide (TPR) repeat protein
MVGSLILSAVLLLGSDPPADPVRDAQSYKKLGDEHVAKDEVRQAADAYEQALSLGRAEFSAAECIRMAVVLSWDDRLKQAIRELNLVLQRDPANLAARIQLARIYSWDGQIARAVDEADTVLMIAPRDSETLLVKANALEWDDRFDEAIPIYKQVIESDGDFSARVGLASSMLYKGDRAEAARLAKRLKASDDREKRQLQRLSDAIAREIRPRMQLGYDYYSDSDQNHFSRYSARYGVGVGNQDFAISLGRTDIDDGSHADDASFEADFHAAGPLGLAAGIGVSRLQGTDGTAQFPIGHVRLHSRFSRTFVSGTLSSEILNETSTLVANHVRRLSAVAEISQKLTPRWSVGGAFTRMRFSDTNSANDGHARAEFALILIPRITLGYQARFADYARQSGSGFFDPSELVSHRVSAALDFENRGFLAFVQVYGGHQRFVRNAFQTSEWAKGGRISLGWKATPKFTIEVTASAGDFATGSVSGFRYFTAGSRVGYRF